MLFGLALDHKAPERFGRLTKHKVPANGLIFSCSCLLPGLVLLYLSDSVIQAFTVATTVASVLFIFVWSIIMVSYLVYRRRNADLHEASTYKMPAGIPLTYVVLFFFVVMLGILALEPDTRIALMFTPIWFIVLGLIYAVQRRRHPDFEAKGAVPEGPEPAMRDELVLTSEIVEPESWSTEDDLQAVIEVTEQRQTPVPGS